MLYDLLFLEYCQQNNIEKVKFYLEYGANVNCKFSYSALHYAVKNNSEDLLDLLLSQPGVDVNIRCTRGNTPLIDACNQRDHLNIVRRLCQVREINPNITSVSGQTALSYAIFRNNAEYVKILSTLTHIPVYWNIANIFGEYPIIMSLKLCHIDIFQIILSTPGIDLSVSDVSGKHITHIALQHYDNRVQRAVELLSKDKRVNWNIKNSDGDTPLMHCLALDKIENAQCLINIPGIDLNTIDSNGYYPEELALATFPPGLKRGRWATARRKSVYEKLISFTQPRLRIIKKQSLKSRQSSIMPSLLSISKDVLLISLITNNKQEIHMKSLVDQLKSKIPKCIIEFLLI